MNDFKANDLVAEIKQDLQERIDRNKGPFSERLSQQLEHLAAHLDPKQVQQLRRLAVDGLVDDASSRVQELILRKVSAMINPTHVIPLYALTPEAAKRLVGKQPSQDEILRRMEDRLNDVAAAAYTALTAKAIYDTLALDPRTETSATRNGSGGQELKQLISEAALAASPIRPAWSGDGTQRDRGIVGTAVKIYDKAKPYLEAAGQALAAYEVVDWVASFF